MDRAKMGNKFHFVTNCVSSDGESIGAMVDQAQDITYRTFAKHCDWQPIARELGYAVGPSPELHMKDDWHIGYYRSKYRGKPCYFFKWSAIEYVFVQTR